MSFCIVPILSHVGLSPFIKTDAILLFPSGKRFYFSMIADKNEVLISQHKFEILPLTPQHLKDQTY